MMLILFSKGGGENEEAPTVISRIAANSPASQASFQEGDVILAINQINIQNHSHEEIVNLIRNSNQLELVIQNSEKKTNNIEDSLELIRNGQCFEQFEVEKRKI